MEAASVKDWFIVLAALAVLTAASWLLRPHEHSPYSSSKKHTEKFQEKAPADTPALRFAHTDGGNRIAHLTDKAAKEKR